MYNATVFTFDKMLFKGDCWSASLPGADGEFEILAFHKPIISLLKRGRIVIDLEKEILIKRGVAKFSNEELIAIVEQ